MLKLRKFYYALPLTLVAMTCIGCATSTSYPTTSSEYVLEEVSLKDICEANGVDWHWDSVSQVITLTSSSATAKALLGSSIVLVGDEKVYLDSPVLNKRSRVVVSSDFTSKVLSKMTSEYVPVAKVTKERERRVRPKREKALPVLPVNTIRKIVIDAGHGGKDPGALGHAGSQEKDVVLDISKKLAKILKKRGFKVKLTRDKDEFISLEKRTNIASKSEADLFISIHANASPSRSVHGFEVFAAKDLQYQDKQNAVRKANLEHMFRHYRMKRNDKDLKKIVEDMLYTHKQTESRELARKMSNAAAKNLRIKNRGDKLSRFFVLRNTFVPAILVEVGFLSNPKEERKLKSANYRKKVAQSIAQSVHHYVKSQ